MTKRSKNRFLILALRIISLGVIFISTGVSGQSIGVAIGLNDDCSWGVGAGVDNLLLESGDNLLLESGTPDVLLLE